MAINTSLSPLPAQDFGYLQAQHLLNRAGFGGTPAQIAHLQTLGLDKAVNLLVDYDSISDADLEKPDADKDILRPPTPEERAAIAKARKEGDEEAVQKYQAERNRREAEDRGQIRALERWWLKRMIETPRPLEEKLTLLWHGHFASNYRTVRDSYLMFQQNQLFRKNAAGNFSDLAYAIIRDPAMIRFLDNNTNRRQHPNENLARELMELFTLGVGNYSESDIKEGARALTGYNFDDNDFTFNQRQHDPGTKTILGQKGSFDGEDFVKIILTQPACSLFVSYKLYRHFAADIDDPKNAPAHVKTVVPALGKVLAENKLALRPTLKVLFKSQHFYDPAIAGNMIKSPAQLIVGSVRIMNTPVRDMGALTDSMNLMGQMLFEPPSVAGWDGGRTWINTSTMFVRQNLCAYLLTGRAAAARRGVPAPAGDDYDPTPLIADLAKKTPPAVTDHLLETLLGSHVLKERREQILAAVNGSPINQSTLTDLLLLITATPEYQLC